MEAEQENSIGAELIPLNIPDGDYDMLVIPYEDATANLLVRLNTLNQDYRLKYKNYPIHHIQNRIKNKKSIEKKLIKRKLSVSAEEARESLTDIAGVRIICYFEEDIYSVVSLIKKQSDILVLIEKDYIKNPKKSGYQSLHLIVEVPFTYKRTVEKQRAEIQIRTVAMDFWAGVDNQICYKKREEEVKRAEGELKQYSDVIAQMDKQMLELRKKVEKIRSFTG